MKVQIMTYKDKTWCCHSSLCANTTCDRNLNDDEVKQAIRWWGGLDFPVVYSDFKTDDCGFIESLPNE